MKKIISIFGVILFACALTLSSCGDNKNDSKKETVECSDADNCEKGCCKGCKATEGEASCDLLKAGNHSCCSENGSENTGCKGGDECLKDKSCCK